MQLIMLKENLNDLPPVVLPAGYKLRHFRLGDEEEWNRVITLSFDDPPCERRFLKRLGRDAACVPERILFVVKDDVPVATASAWFRPEWGVDTGYVHYVGTDPEHKGHRLGYWASLAVLHRFVFEGRTRAMLQTDDHRVPAIKTYLQLGFEPFLVEDDQRVRWPKIIETHGFQALCPRR